MLGEDVMGVNDGGRVTPDAGTVQAPMELSLRMGEARATVARRSDRRDRETMMMNVNWE
jgi:hypothetical protein